ncbi:hypothetical protein YTPLAS21_19120 [Candidatus Nitrosocosmicus sp.]|nr:hypothetical protein YTPLAS21_19120 [Candidatus Nitrosocosmicus sp.]
MSYTTSQLITGAYYASGVVSRDFDTVSGSQSADGLVWLNEILAQKTVQDGLIPYETTYIFDAVIGQEEYFIPNLIGVDVLTFTDDSVRYPMVYTSRNDYFGGSRANNVQGLPNIYTFERYPQGCSVYVYMKPSESYQFQLRGSFRLADVTLTQNLLSHQTIANLGTPVIGGNGTFIQEELIVNDYDLYNIFLADCVAASTAALTATYANGTLGVGATLTNSGAMVALTLDGVTLVAGDRVLIKDQASTFQNGIYTVTVVGDGATNWVLTRSTDFDTTGEMIIGLTTEITSGTVNASTAFSLQAAVAVVGTNAVTFAAFDATDLVNFINTGVITGVTAAISGTEFVLTSVENPKPLTIYLQSNGTMGSTNYITFPVFDTLHGTNNRSFQVSTIDQFYITYLRYELAARICVEYAQPIPPNVLSVLDQYRREINKRSKPLDLRLQKENLFGVGGTINYGYINFGKGWTVP